MVEVNTVMGERSCMKPTEETEMMEEFEFKDNFEDNGGRVSILAE